MMSGIRSSSIGEPSTRRCRGGETVHRAPSSIALGLGLGLLLTACVPPENDQRSTESTQEQQATPEARGTGETQVPQETQGSPNAQATPNSGPDACVASAGATVRDIDPDDSPVKPWQKPAGAELVVEFETGPLSARYAGMVAEAAAIWSESPCLNAVVVQTCSSGTNCVVVTEDGGRSRNTDGEMDWVGDGDYMESSTVVLYTQPLERTTDNGTLATIVHEMGHTLGLDHRLERSDVMNAVTGDATNPMPDAVDFANLVAIYGS